MKGYYNNAAETEKKLKDSWLDTGDLGYLDEDGYLYIAGRSDDMIVKSGLNVYPQEVENKLLKVPEVEEAMVYGELINDVVQICADVVIDENYQQCDSQYIMNCAAEILPPHLMPYRLNIVEQLPKNGSGKKLRPRIKRQMKS
jgi:acyl-coenzyme A synthetase/AMP-(fatty) acid ligase